MADRSKRRRGIWRTAKAAKRVFVSSLPRVTFREQTLVISRECRRVRAVEYLFEHKTACNVVLGVETPGQLSAADFQVQERVDHFFQRHAALPISTVATTIFPGSEYLHGGAPEVFNEFPKMFTKIRESGGWGTYAMRMLTRSLQGPEEKSFISPLEHLVTK